MDNFDLRKYLKEGKLFKESPQFIDKTSFGAPPLPMLMGEVLDKPLLTRTEALAQSPQIPGVYFMYLTSEGVQKWEEILDKYFGSSSPINYCTTHSDGSILVYVGLAKNLKERFNHHIGTGNLKASTFKRKIAPIFLPNSPQDYQTFNKAFAKDFRDEFNTIIDSSMMFNYLGIDEIHKEVDLSSDYRTILEPIVNKVEDSYIKGCVLYLNKKGTEKVPQSKYNLSSRK